MFPLLLVLQLLLAIFGSVVAEDDGVVVIHPEELPPVSFSL